MVLMYLRPSLDETGRGDTDRYRSTATLIGGPLRGLGSASVTEAARQMQVFLGGPGQDSYQHDSIRVDRHHLRDGGVGFFVAQDEEHPGLEADTASGVADVGVRQPLTVGAVVVDPQNPRPVA